MHLASKAGSPSERRWVTKAIRAAVARIDAILPDVGQDLRRTLPQGEDPGRHA